MKKRLCLLTVLAVLLVAQSYFVTTEGEANSAPVQWTMFRHDLSHSGYTNNADNSANSAKLLWTCSEMVEPIFSSPAVFNGTVLVGSNDGFVYCINASNGLKIWSYHTQNQVKSSPAISAGRLFIGSCDGSLYCLNVNSGEVVWNSPLCAEVRSSPAVNGDFIYVGSAADDFFCLNATDGTIIWQFLTASQINSSPAVYNGVVYFCCDDRVYAVNASTGGEMWHQRTQSDISSPCLSDGYLFVGSYNGYVYCLNASTGQEVWKFKTQNSVDSSPAIAYGLIYVGSNDGSLYCLNATDGHKVWQRPTGYFVVSSPTVDGGNVFVGSQDYNIYCFDAFSGEERWSYQTGNNVDSSPAIVNNTLYVGSFDNKLYALSLSSSEAQSLPKVANPTMPGTITFDAAAAATCITVIVVAVYLGIRFRREDREKQASLPSTEKKHWLTRHTEAVLIVLIFVFSAFFYVNLGSASFFADEKTYSQWAFHMVKTGDYLTPWNEGQLSVWIAKPPLLMWLMSVSYQFLGVSTFASRIWTPLFAAFSMVLVLYLGKKMYNLAVGYTAAIVLGTFVTFFVYSRAAMTDIPLVCFMLASMYFLLESEKNKHSYQYAALSGVFFGLALMTKQVAALFIPAIVIIYWVATKRSFKCLLTKQFALFAGIGLLIFVPWLILMYADFGSEFVHWFLMYTGVNRTFSVLEGHVGTPFFYFNFLFTQENLLWVAMLPFALALCLYKTVKKRSKPDFLILIWVTVVLGVFTVAETKIFWYILPVYPAFALAISSMLYELARFVQLKLRKKPAGKNLLRTENDSPLIKVDKDCRP